MLKFKKIPDPTAFTPLEMGIRPMNLTKRSGNNKFFYEKESILQKCQRRFLSRAAFTPFRDSKNMIKSFSGHLKNIGKSCLILDIFSQKRRKHFLSLTGFTLMELLIVMVILGMLLGFILPASSKMREQGRRITCLNNLRQHGMAWHLYIQEHNDSFPRYSSSLPPSQGYAYTYYFGGKIGYLRGSDPNYGAQYRALNKYLDITGANAETSPNIELFHCPDDKNPYFLNQYTIFDYYGTTYVMNNRILAYTLTYQPRPLSTITLPKDKVALEYDYYYARPGHGGKGYTAGITPVMTLFVDGHVGGPFLYNNDFSTYDPNLNRKVILDPNGTSSAYD